MREIDRDVEIRGDGGREGPVEEENPTVRP